jgi:uncharacterized protein (TIGR02147 family)
LDLNTKTVFDFNDYKAYLAERAGGRRQRRGIRSLIAKTLKCQPTYVSQVLNGSADFSPEQAEVLNRFFGHTREESTYFLLLIQKERAGTRALKEFIQSQLDEILTRRMAISQRLGQKAGLTQEQQATYYSSWHFSAVHVALTIPSLRRREAIAHHLRISLKKVDEVLKFLVAAGLAQTNGLDYATTEVQIHLGNDSHNIVKHHSHWRQQALESLDREELSDLHYSTVVSLSRQDVFNIKNRLLEEIKAAQAIIKDSPEEELYAYTMDFFSMRR